MTEPFVCPSQLIVQIVEEETGAPIPGLYVLYRVAPPPPEPPETGLVNFLAGLVYEDEPEPPPDPFLLGVTDPSGYLLHGYDAGGGPIVDYCPTESVKLGAGVAYEFHFVRHPDHALVLQFEGEVNGAAAADLTASWGAPLKLTPDITTNDAGDDQLTLSIGSDPANFHPAGASRYGGWVLYKDMPHAEVQSVKDAVKQLQLDLGALRYIIGAEPPYEPETLRHDKDGKPINQATVNEGVFDARTMSAVLHFQRQLDLGTDGITPNAFAVDDTGAAHGRATGAGAIAGSWSYLEGTEVNVPAPAPQAGERTLAVDGVADAITERALTEWRDGGLRKTGAILVAMEAGLVGGWHVWLRAEGAYALDAWRKLTVALGCEKGVAVNHTYRTPLTDVGQAGYGRSAVSIHKTGLAIDLRMSKFLPMASWPVLVDRDTLEPKTSKGVLIGHRAYFRLYSPSKLPADDAQAAAQIREAMTDYAGTGGVLGSGADQLLAMSDEALLGTYFKATARSWNYDPYDDEGGTEGPEVSPSTHFGDPTYTRWLDLTKLAELCGLRRIGSFTNKLAPTSTDWGLARSATKPDKIGKLKYLADQLVAAQARVTDPADVTFNKRSVPLASVRASFLKQYAELLPQMTSMATIYGPRLTIAISWTSKTRTKCESAAGKLETLGSEMFVGVDQGNEVKTAAEWAAWLREKLAQLDPAVPANQTTGGSSASAKPPQRLTLLPVAAELEDGTPITVSNKETVGYPAPGTPIGMEWWHFQQDSIVRSVKRFGTLLCDLGWTEEGLLNTYSPVTHFRMGVGYPQSELDKKVG